MDKDTGNLEYKQKIHHYKLIFDTTLHIFRFPILGKVVVIAFIVINVPVIAGIQFKTVRQYCSDGIQHFRIDWYLKLVKVADSSFPAAPIFTEWESSNDLWRNLRIRHG